MSAQTPKPPVEPAHSLFGRERYPLDVFFKPQSVAVIGATEAGNSVGRTALFNLISSPFGGSVYPVNPKRSRVLGMRCYPSVRDLPEPIDLAIVVTPAATVREVIRECVEAGVQGAIILAAGFRELGPEGEARERLVLEEARKGSLRILGPNSLGVMCPVTGLNASFASGMARPGSVAFLSQSGALCTAVLDWSERELVGFSAFVSVGSMADIGWSDLIDYLANDPHTRSILLYMESIGNARAFLSAAREVAFSKPIIVIKAGRTPEGARAAAAHTGAQAGNDEVIDAVLRRCGVLRVERISDLFYMAEVLGKQPRPRGKRLTIISNAGGPSVLATDALIKDGGQLAPLAPETIEALNQVLPAEWSHINPIDILGDAKPERYAKVMEIVTRDSTSDGFLVILAPQTYTDPIHTAEQLKPFARIAGKPLLASWMGGVSISPGVGLLQASGIPTFSYPDAAAQMFLYMSAYEENLHSIYETPVADDTSVRVPDITVPPDSPLIIGAFLDDQIGPVLYAESSFGARAVGLPPLTTTLARLMLRELNLLHVLGDQAGHYARLLVRLGRLVIEQPRIRSIRITGAGHDVEYHPDSIPADQLPRTAIRPYPVEYMGTWRMKNNETVTIRPIRPEDEPLIAGFHETLSDQTVYFRYLSALKLSTRVAHERLIRICFIDYSRQIALVAVQRNEVGGDEKINAVGRLHLDQQAYARGLREAEFALVVSDKMQRQGLGKELLRRLIEIGGREGVETIYGEISAENAAMQRICRSMGFQIRRESAGSTVLARLRIPPLPHEPAKTRQQ